ncbi:hypothetical protein AUEXF2481DRAFT_91290 [Aureobasidium subglaciale EXF-2481]|uniref:Uncharacterized protein n=1 Tax=Aureobasidium subglaciale (strain EXF-2481) TaxID=1043005 RepID=A0A074Y4D5_AURSE|nr:uncharacterized protein AUEXF2481DRAFT_91290 [Aureobasidium subglaciale EXF-2481]KAI5197063.1 hypothetical protein E4T38_08178 [Aureobasidium subglaciale]KAI5215760.1 hypothetical protein E4T40_08188 [Aureobasidium subglaciale]KAI5219017.1 hypothetical protein E4T41_08103 [Aureobasidium subglaciale]KAI5256581.1 hypothetical protein E4T46_08079 [Aureobasidium subglaciale]KEQ92570.1 hypothetical protein AUEXF2481DRAFT_91290 [Aureobasidium subglaciale EXF-2481]
MAQLISGIVETIGGGIGLASESYKAHKANKIRLQPDEASQQPEPSPGRERPANEFEEEAWELDEAQDELVGIPRNREADEPADPATFAETFISRLPPYSFEDLPASQEKLPFPIIIPQRRPTDRSRGVVRAYPPILSDRGIDQATFIDFIETFNKSTQASKWIAALNLASIGTIWLPTVTSILVSMAITAVTTAAMEVQGRYKTNTFLDKINKDFFMPRGLFCLVLTWNPDNADARTTVGFNNIAAKAMSGDNEQFMSSLRKSNGKTYGEFQWPEVAPLIYPGLDVLAATSDEEGRKKKSSLKTKRGFVEDYMDRRAQAKFAMKNPDSTLTAGPKPKFSSRFADPSHPVNSGSLVALISGGAIQLPERTMGGRGGQRFGSGSMISTRFDRDFGGRFDRGSSRVLRRRFDEVDQDDTVGTGLSNGAASSSRVARGGLGGIRGGRGGANSGPLGLVQKVMKKDVLYLLIVDMPTDEELAAAQTISSELLTGQRSY